VVSNISLMGALGAGLLSFLSPCVLPLVPLISVSGRRKPGNLKQDGTPRGAHQIGMVALSCACARLLDGVCGPGASASLIGKAVSSHFETLGVIAGVLIVVLGLHFLGLFRIGLLFREARFQRVQQAGGISRCLPGWPRIRIRWTPCAGPVAAILIVAGGIRSARCVLLGTYALGIGCPFLLASLFSGQFIRLMTRIRHHMGAVEKVIGSALVLTGVVFLAGGMPRIAGWLLQAFPAFGSIG
jgi:cytochrome c-type biogenesis protein